MFEWECPTGGWFARQEEGDRHLLAYESSRLSREISFPWCLFSSRLSLAMIIQIFSDIAVAESIPINRVDFVMSLKEDECKVDSVSKDKIVVPFCALLLVFSLRG